MPYAVSCIAAPQLRQKMPVGGVISARASQTEPVNVECGTATGALMNPYDSDMTVDLK